MSISFRIGAGKVVEVYSIDNPLPSWHLEGGEPSCDACHKPLHFIWDSPKAKSAGIDPGLASNHSRAF